jgi:hypothetical protein
MNGTVDKRLADLEPLLSGQRRFDSMAVGCPQLNRLKTRQSAVLDQSRNIPVFTQVVGDST